MQRKIDLSRLPSNDFNPRGEPAEIVPVAHGRSKKTSFSSEIRKIINSLFQSVVIPSTKTMLYEFLNGGLHQIILGKPSQTVGRGLPGYNAYHRMYAPASRATVSRGGGYLQRGIVTSSVVDEDIFFDFEDEAMLVLAAMVERIATYGRVSLMDMRNLCRLPTTPTHHRYGWTDLSTAEVVATTEGWVITLPQMEYI